MSLKLCLCRASLPPLAFIRTVTCFCLPYGSFLRCVRLYLVFTILCSKNDLELLGVYDLVPDFVTSVFLLKSEDGTWHQEQAVQQVQCNLFALFFLLQSVIKLGAFFVLFCFLVLPRGKKKISGCNIEFS